jgi:hypothetical protein
MTSSDRNTRTVRVYEPVADEDKTHIELAQRLPTLEGKVIGLLDNTKDLVDTLLDEVKTLLAAEFPGVRFRYFRKESVSGARPDLLEQIAACDAVVTGVGD